MVERREEWMIRFKGEHSDLDSGGHVLLFGSLTECEEAETK